MKSNPIPLILICLLISFSSVAQNDSRHTIFLKSGSFIPQKNITDEQLNDFNKRIFKNGEQRLIIIQFEQIPTEEQKQQLFQSGIQLLEYVPDNAYTASVGGILNTELLKQVNARSIIELSPLQKMQPELANGIFPSHAIKVAGTIDVWITAAPSFSFEKIKKELEQNNFNIISSQFKDQNIFAVRLSTLRLKELASLSFIEFIEPAPAEDKPLINVSKIVSRANVLNKSFSSGGRNLLGDSVVIGIGDNADPVHVDFSGRKISRAAIIPNYHGTHVHGIAGGAGIWNELYTGYAPKAKLLSQSFAGVWINAAAYYTDHRMVITNNSYGNEASDCSYFGLYDSYSRILDAQAISLPKVTNVFAAGNSGFSNCSPFPGLKTVFGGYQAAKNVITVGNAYSVGSIFPNSSRGPVKDGRIKPEITTQGAFVVASATFADYYENTGTSMAAPAVSGGLALLYQRYRQLKGFAFDPDNVLMKTILCNSATDKGNPGPDYTYGFGLMNLLRAVEALEAGQYAQNSVANGAENVFSINVPANTAQLKVMLCWNDPAASPVSSKALVNNLDLKLTNTAATYLPLILDTVTNSNNDNAKQGTDALNNIEQVTINNPSGSYTVHVKGSSVPVSAPQSYTVAYDIIPVSTTLTSPTGGEKILPGETIIISWDTYGGTTENFTLEYSSNNGTTWQTIDNNIPSATTLYGWVAPATVTNEAKIRLTKNNTAQVSTSGVFTVLGAPALNLSAVQCEGYISVDWTSVPNATGYEIMKLEGDEMKRVAIVPNAINTYSIGGLSKDSVYWVTVRALNGSFPGRRDTAVFRQPNTGTCTGSVSNNDLKIESIVSPVSSGRKFTSTELSSVVPVTIRIKNLDDQNSTGNINVSYFINNILQQTQTISPSIAAAAATDYTFPLAANFSTVGTYTLKVSVTKSGDGVVANDTLTKIFKQLDNQPLSLPFTDNIDAAPIQSVTASQIGLQNLDRYDFVNNTPLGRIRTFINTGIAFSGNRALTIDAERYIPSGNTDSLTGTYNINLAGYNAATDEIRLDFRYKNHGQTNNPANKVWIRGSDAGTWKEAYDLFANQNPADGSFKFTSSIEVGDILSAVPAQTFTPSFQVRWGQYGIHQAADNTSGAGYTFDDIRLYKVTDDVQMISIDAPIASGCGLTASNPVTITVRNSRNTAIPSTPGVPVRFRVDNGAWVTGTVPGIAANASVAYTFTTGANLATPGAHLLETGVVYPSDTFHDNDTLSITVVNSPVITSFPHLENFENNNGSWYTGGRFSSWEYGTPQSNKIIRAASGSKAWKTRVNGSYNDNERSYLYSPCYNVAAMVNPTLSFSLALDIEDCGASLCDGAYVEYSTDGNTWSRLGAVGQGTNWYNKNYAGNNLWSNENYSRWHVATIPLSVTGVSIPLMTKMRFRFVMTSDEGLNKDGIAIDDIHIYDNTSGIYDGPTLASPIANNIPGSANWVDFKSGNKLIASVKSPVANLGAANTQVYINTGAVRNRGGQYYHDRNITIKPATLTTGNDSASIRFYFLDNETETLINATGCANCYKPKSAYELGISKYDDANDDLENGTAADDQTGTWSFINSDKAVKVPFDKGYYAEFKVKDFSEFWLNNGGFGLNQPLPVQIINFTAVKNNNDVLAEWTTAGEQNINRFEIEVAKGNVALQLNQFVKIGEVASQGNSAQERHYSFTDIEAGKTGVRYYRLKIIENDGSFIYSEIRAVIFDSGLSGQVFPNPSSDVFNFTFQVSNGEMVTVNIYNSLGQKMQQHQIQATGFLQKIVIDMRDAKFAPGLYMLEAMSEGGKQTLRLIKQ